MISISLPDRIRQTLRQDVQSMHAYAVQPSAGFVKLDAMENPFTLPPELQRELGERLSRVAINRYPGAGTAALAQDLRHAEQVAQPGIPGGSGERQQQRAAGIAGIGDMRSARQLPGQPGLNRAQRQPPG